MKEIKTEKSPSHSHIEVRKKSSILTADKRGFFAPLNMTSPPRGLPSGLRKFTSTKNGGFNSPKTKLSSAFQSKNFSKYKGKKFRKSYIPTQDNLSDMEKTSQITSNTKLSR
jgi:hypothetical protein